MVPLLKFLNAIYPLSERLVDYLQKHVKTRRISKKAFLLNAGEVSQHIFFIESGLVRCFYLKNGVEVSSWFMKEGDTIVSVGSFFDQKESFESIQALEDSTVHGISFDELQFIYKNFSEFNFIGRVLTEKYYVLSEQRLYSLRMQRAQERYEFMIRNHPELINRVPSHFMASYLSITKETLSRIRGRKLLTGKRVD